MLPLLYSCPVFSYYLNRQTPPVLPQRGTTPPRLHFSKLLLVSCKFLAFQYIQTQVFISFSFSLTKTSNYLKSCHLPFHFLEDTFIHLSKMFKKKFSQEFAELKTELDIFIICTHHEETVNDAQHQIICVTSIYVEKWMWHGLRLFLSLLLCAVTLPEALYYVSIFKTMHTFSFVSIISIKRTKITHNLASKTTTLPLNN